jgi:hypothetical protein
MADHTDRAQSASAGEKGTLVVEKLPLTPQEIGTVRTPGPMASGPAR